MGSSKRKRKSESEANMSGTGDPSANLYSLDGKRINTGTGDRECKRFDRLSLSPMLLNGVKDLGYEKMTLVQEATLPAILQGKDVLAKAKTGMEKTLAFSLPLIGIVLKFPRTSPDFKRSSAINVLVMCPNRELVNQVASEANNLLKHSPSFWSYPNVLNQGAISFLSTRLWVIVATPTRLWDHIENTRGFEGRLRDVNVLVLHEADCLLAMHIRKDVEKIIAAVHQFCHNTLRKDHEFIDIVQESSEETHSQAQQMHLIAPLDKRFSLLYILLQEHIVNDVDYKAIVFCTTTAVTRLVAEFLCKLNMNVGVPSNRAQYIHRLGGTGHDGKKAQGMLLLAPWEGFFLSSIKDLAIAEAPLPLVDPGGGGAFRHREEDQRVGLYVACFRYYSRIKKVGEDKHRLVELANDLSRSIGLYNLPEIPTRILNEMGLMNSPAVRATLDHNWIFT
ncbi:hypothetical protein ES288_D07G164100v1 [Gossypium darwinii]|uniref:ATP-dependent RNA helicase n=1 Tax=Gossypium darwinii TaxID=34276 RepID=A0A5D2BYN3_GOSDA|nr:hypothetical protein ES288_D07G164100v1 [Gossypium darwinii]